MASGRVATLLAAAALVGCFFDPTLGRGRIRCSPEGECPSAEICGGDGRCYPSGSLVRVSVSIVPPGGGRIVSSPPGIDCSSTSTQCAADLPRDVPLRIAGIADDGQRFAAWTGCSASAYDSAVCLITVGGDAADPVLSAAFAPLTGGETLWARSFGGTGVDESFGIALGPAPDPVPPAPAGPAPVWVAGGFASPMLSLGPGFDVMNGGVDTDDALLAGFSLDNGTSQKLRAFSSGNGYENLWHVATDSGGGIYIAGYFENTVDFGDPANPLTSEGYDAFVAAYDTDGSYLWATQFKCADTFNDQAQGIAATATGEVYVTGVFSDDSPTGCDFGVGPPIRSAVLAPFVVKLSTDGTPEWVRVFPPSGEDANGQGIRVATSDTNGDVAVVGSFRGALEVDPIGPVQLEASGAAEDAFVIMLSGSNGDTLWAQRFGGPGADWANAVAIDLSSNVYVTGRFEETVTFKDEPRTAVGLADAFLLKLSGGQGMPAWDRTFGGSEVDIGYGVAVDYDSHDVVVTGQINGSVDFGSGIVLESQQQDVFVARFPPDGQSPRWVRRLGGPDNDVAYDITVAPAGRHEVLVVGTFRQNADLGLATSFTSNGEEDSFVLALKP